MHAKKRSKLLNQNKCLMIFYLMLYLFAEFKKKHKHNAKVANFYFV